MNYLEYINSRLKSSLADAPAMVIYGQNIAAGSCLGGLTRGIKLSEGSKIINSTNSESTLVGVGFGLMASEMNSIFFMKQLDFLLLGVDQIVNTQNILRTTHPKAAFTIMPVVVDSGYDGPQSSLNTMPDFCSMSCSDGFTLTNRHDIDFAIDKLILNPGFRIVGLSQRLLKTELIEFKEPVSNDRSGGWFKYKHGDDLSIICFNFSLPQGLKLANDLDSRGICCSIYSINHTFQKNWAPIIQDIKRTSNILLLDDCKSNNSPVYEMAHLAMQSIPPNRVRIEKRSFTNDWFAPSKDDFSVDPDHIFNWLKSSEI